MGVRVISCMWRPEVRCRFSGHLKKIIILCACNVGMKERVHVPRCTRGDQRIPSGVGFLSPLPWILELELRLPGLGDKCLYLLGHFTGPQSCYVALTVLELTQASADLIQSLLPSLSGSWESCYAVPRPTIPEFG